ncbi:MAG: hypothetical protein AAGI03_06610 [Pseudomonadota bacterium]
MSAPEKETPGAGRRTGGKGEHDNHHPDIIAPNIADLSQSGERERLLEEAVTFLMAWAPEGPWMLTAIVPDSGRIQTVTFEAGKQAEMRDWIEERQGKWNMYFTVNRTNGDIGSKPKKADMAARRAARRC